MTGTRAAAPLRVGAAAVDVTPQGPVTLSGFGARTSPSTGVHDALYARALALAEPGGPPVVLLALDLLGVDEHLAAAIRAGLAHAGVAPERVAVVATHTHGGPAVLRDAFLGSVAEGPVARIVAGAVSAGTTALAALRPATARFGRARVHGVARNRRVAGGPVDERLSVLSFWRHGTSAPVAVLTSFALHPVVLGADNLLVTRDYVGYLVDAVEAGHPGTVALFACGCAGQVNTGHPAAASWSTAAAAGRTFETAATVGGRLAAAVNEVLAGGSEPLDGGCVAVATAECELSFASRAGEPVPEVERLEAELMAAEARDDAAAAGLIDGQLAWARWRANLDTALTERVRVPLQGVRVGDVVLLLLPGEPFVEYGLTLTARHGERVVPIGYANAAPGYIPTAAAFAQGGYEVDLAYRYYGQAGPFTPACEDSVLAACGELLARLRPDTLA